MASVNSSSHLIKVDWDNGKYAFLNRADKKIECDATIENVAPVLVGEFNFDPEKIHQLVANMGACLGKNAQGEINRDRANQTLKALVQQGKITIEQVGFRKPNQGGAVNGVQAPKFYLMINTPLGKGGNNQFHVGFSRRGTLRAVLRSSKGGKPNPVLAKELSKKEAIPFSRRSLRIMNEDSERGITILELGGENLRKFPIAKHSREERWQLYLSIFQGLHQIHKLGVHLDVKPENLVIDEEGGAKFIDFDTMRRHGRAVGEEKNGQIFPALAGTILYYSPKQLAAFMANKPFVADKKDDVWAAMLTICELESKVPEQDRMLSPEMVDRFKQYNDFRFGVVKQFNRNDYRDAALFEARFIAGPWERNLFDEVHENLDGVASSQLIDAVLESKQHPLNPLIYAMGITRSSDRVDATTALVSFAHPAIQSRIPQRIPLAQFDIGQLSRVKRYSFYTSLLEQLYRIHSKGKALNGLTSHSVLIDPMHRPELIPTCEGDPLYFAPEQFIEDSPCPPPKGDIWSIMMLICDLEAKVPSYDRLLSDPFIEQFLRYCSHVLSQMNPQDRAESYRTIHASLGKVFAERLFEGIIPEKDGYRYPLDRLVGLMARKTPNRRCTAERMLREFSSVSLNLIEERKNLLSFLFGPKN